MVLAAKYSGFFERGTKDKDNYKQGNYFGTRKVYVGLLHPGLFN